MRLLFTLVTIIGFNVSAFANDGTVDASFGSGGIAQSGTVNADFPSGGSLSIPPVVQPDGKILICGTQATFGASGRDMLVARFTADGELDTSFSFDGKVTIDFDGGAGSDYCTAIALQSDGKIVVAGYTSTGAANGSDFAVARLNSDGTLDTTMFGGGTGKTTIGFDLGGGNDDEASSLAIQPDGKIVVAGSATTAANASAFAAVRLLSDGSRDTSFNLTGKVTVAFNLASGTATNMDAATSVAIDRSGNIVLGGFANKGMVTTDTDFAIARLLPNGTLDSNFDADGRVTIPFDLGGANGSNAEKAYAMKIQHDGKIVLAGYADTSSSPTFNQDIAVARVQPDGSLDSGFGVGGKILVPIDLTPNGIDLALALTEQSNGKLVLGGASQSGAPATFDLTIVRLNLDGSLDPEFGSLGKKTFDPGLFSPASQLIYGLAFQGTQIIASGLARVAPTGPTTTGYDNIVIRLKNDLVFADEFD